MNKLLIFSSVICLIVGFSIAIIIQPKINGDYEARIVSLEGRVSWLETSLSSCSACSFKPQEEVEKKCVCYSPRELRMSAVPWTEEDAAIISLCRKQLTKDACLSIEYGGLDAQCSWSC